MDFDDPKMSAFRSILSALIPHEFKTFNNTEMGKLTAKFSIDAADISDVQILLEFGASIYHQTRRSNSDMN